MATERQTAEAAKNIKAPKNIESREWEPIDWGKLPALEGLERMRDRAQQQAIETVDWYYSKKNSKNFWSRWLRLWAIAYTILGGLVPVLSAAGFIQLLSHYWLHIGVERIQFWELRFNQLGYVFIGIAAGCVAFDRFFGFSTNWMRYIGATMRIETARVRFAYDWEHIVAPLKGAEPDAKQIQELLEILEKFSLSVREAVETETSAWIAEFRTNLAQLDKETKELLEGARAERKAVDQRVKARKAGDRQPRDQHNGN